MTPDDYDPFLDDPDHYRGQPEPDEEYLAREHREDMHDGGPCDCPPPAASAGGPEYADEAPF